MSFVSIIEDNGTCWSCKHKSQDITGNFTCSKGKFVICDGKGNINNYTCKKYDYQYNENEENQMKIVFGFRKISKHKE